MEFLNSLEIPRTAPPSHQRASTLLAAEQECEWESVHRA